LSTLVVTFLLIVPAILVTTLFIREAFAVSRGMQHTLLVQQAPMLAKSWAWIAQHVPGLDPNADVLEMLAQAVLDEVRVAGTRSGWRAEALAVCSALERMTARRRDAAVTPLPRLDLR